MTKREPVRHHYIPQFILRNFCFNDRKLLYFGKDSFQMSVKDTMGVFMERNLYRDDINNPNNPTKIEMDMACFESEVSQIIKKGFLDREEVFLTLEEDEQLKIFLR